MRRIKLFLLNGLILTATSILMRVVGFSFSVYISNKIGSEAVGIFSLIMSVYMFSITLATSGINIATTKLVVEETTFNPKTKLSKVMTKCIEYSLFFGLIASLLLTLLAKPINFFLLHNKIPTYLFYIIAISLPFISMSSALNGYFTGLRKNGQNAFAKILEQFVKILFTGFLFSLFIPNSLEYACLALILGETVSEIFSFFIIYILYICDKKNFTFPSNSKNFLKRICKISLPISFTSYIRSGLSSLKQLLIPLRLEKSGMSCESSVANYGLINGMVMPVLMFPEVIINSFSSLLVPEFTYFYTKKDTKNINRIICKIFKVSILFSVGVVGIFSYFSDKISLIIYNNLEVAYYLKILCPLLVFMYLDSIVDNILKGLNEQIGVMKCNILDLFVSIFCIYFLVPIFGIKGYLFVIFLSELLNSSISILQLKHVTNFKIDFSNWIVKPFIGIVFSYIVTSIFINTSDLSFSNTILQIFFYICCYFIFLLFSKCIEKKE